jgi:hypothetical protein
LAVATCRHIIIIIFIIIIITVNYAFFRIHLSTVIECFSWILLLVWTTRYASTVATVAWIDRHHETTILLGESGITTGSIGSEG